MRTLLLAFLTLSALSHAKDWKADDILGIWWTPKKDGRIEIYKEKEKYFGKIVWLIPEERESVDEKNPDKEKRKTPLQGLVNLKNFEFTGDSWEEGTIYDPDNGSTYDCILKLKNINKLKVRGYIGISLLGRTEIFKRYINKKD